MFRTIFWGLWVFIYLLRKLPLYFKIKRLRKKGEDEERRVLLNREIALWTERMMKHIKMDLTVEGKENLPDVGEPVLFVANHQSYLDIPIVLYGLGEPYPLMAKKSITRVPLLRLWLKELGCIYVDRDNVREALKTMHEGEKILETGESLILFPEGTRSQSNTMVEFKMGGIRMAKQAGVPIVPLAIDGTYLALEGNNYRLQPADVRLVILPPIPTQEMSREDYRALPETLYEQINTAKENRPDGLQPPRE